MKLECEKKLRSFDEYYKRNINAVLVTRTLVYQYRFNIQGINPEQPDLTHGTDEDLLDLSYTRDTGHRKDPRRLVQDSDEHKVEIANLQDTLKEIEKTLLQKGRPTPAPRLQLIKITFYTTKVCSISRMDHASEKCQLSYCTKSMGICSALKVRDLIFDLNVQPPGFGLSIEQRTRCNLRTLEQHAVTIG